VTSLFQENMDPMTEFIESINSDSLEKEINEVCNEIERLEEIQSQIKLPDK
jgi:hypothetical protein